MPGSNVFVLEKSMHMSIQFADELEYLLLIRATEKYR